MAKTLQSNIHTHNYSTLTDYALFVGGMDVTHDALLQYDPLKTGFGRLFMIRKPIYLDNYIPEELKKVKHIFEYANVGVNGINDVQVDFESMTGSYTGKQMEIPMIAKDDTNRFTIKTYEFSGSPIRQVLHTWITGVADTQTGLSHYHNVDLDVNQANHTAEFIYITTDQTGKRIEYACMFANCFPTGIKLDHFNYESGQHSLVPLDVEFACTKYESPQINMIAGQLLAKYNVLISCLDFNSGFTTEDVVALPETALKNSTNNAG